MITENDHSSITRYSACDQPFKMKTVLTLINVCKISNSINTNLVEGVRTLVRLLELPEPRLEREPPPHQPPTQ
jgi:hypothetical protein